MSRYLPILTWSRHYTRDTFANDAVAAVIVTIMLIPQSLAYALLAGLPPEVGLYASIAPLLLYTMFGSSMTLAVGPVAVASLMTAAAIGNLMERGTPEYLGAAILLALLSGLMLLAMGLAALFCVGIGIFPHLLYAQLPYPVDYHPYSGAHVTESLGVLMFTLLAFVLFLKYLDPEKTISLDTDWVYRRGASAFMWIARRPVLIWEQWLITLGDGAGLRLLHRLSRVSLRFDTHVIDAAVNGVALTALRLGLLLRYLQTGIVSHYALVMIAGVILLLGWPLFVAMGAP